MRMFCFKGLLANLSVRLPWGWLGLQSMIVVKQAEIRACNQSLAGCPGWLQVDCWLGLISGRIQPSRKASDV